MAAKKPKLKPPVKKKAETITRTKPAPRKDTPLDPLDGVSLDGITNREILFVRAYLTNNGDSVKAMRDLGHDGTDDACRALASYYRRRPAVRRVIDEILSGYAMSGAEAVSELSKIGWMPTIFETLDGRVIETDPRNVKNKVTALQTVLKYHGLLKENVKLDVDLKNLTDDQLAELLAALTGGKG